MIAIAEGVLFVDSADAKIDYLDDDDAIYGNTTTGEPEFILEDCADTAVPIKHPIANPIYGTTAQDDVKTGDIIRVRIDAPITIITPLIPFDTLNITLEGQRTIIKEIIVENLICGDGTCNAIGGETNCNCPSDCTTGTCVIGPGGSCGDGICQFGEDSSCSDCTAPCGDGLCNGGETIASCQADCVVCGDGVCSIYENSSTCLDDCGTIPYCGDGTCGAGEDMTNCPGDCAPTCDSDGTCEPGDGETFLGCPSDCFCDGDGVSCDANQGEDTVTCGADCWSCNNDSTCDIANGEDNASCPADCPIITCPDTVCDPGIGETTATCTDCSCGDGVCNPLDEDWTTCSADCTCTGNHVESMAGSVSTVGNLYDSTVTITIHDDTGTFAVGVTVTGDWIGPPGAPTGVTCVTNGLGECSVSLLSTNKNDSLTATFEVTGISGGTYCTVDDFDAPPDIICQWKIPLCIF